MTKKILFQIDVDLHASSFDRVVAVDSGIDHVFAYSQVNSDQITGLIHGAMFTRGPDELRNTAAFFGGSNVDQASEIYRLAQKAFFGPLRVSMMFDPNGCNTTAAAAVLRCLEQTPLAGRRVIVLGGTGPVGSRIAALAAAAGAKVTLTSRSLARAQASCESLKKLPQLAGENTELEAIESRSSEDLLQRVQSADILFAAGAAGVEFLPNDWLTRAGNQLKLAIDVNAVPPLGLPGISASDKGKEHQGIICFGAMGVGGLKMKIHKAALMALFSKNDLDLNTFEIFELGKQFI